MNDPIKTVTTALEYHDTNNEKYKNMFKNIKYIKFEQGEDDFTYNTINMYDKNQQICIQYLYSIYSSLIILHGDRYLLCFK